MFKTILTRIAQKHRTVKYPLVEPVLPARFRGLPSIDSSKCPAECDACAAACPVDAITRPAAKTTLDLGKCIFCGACETACPEGALKFGSDHRLSVTRREDLLVDGTAPFKRAAPLDSERLQLFRKSIKLRQVSAGGCNACESDVNVLNTIVFDLSRFGVQFVASPRHADGLLITGPVTKNMELALKKTYDATPAPKAVILVGACAISGGMFAGHSQVKENAAAFLDADLYIPGCPPHPYTILDGILRLLDRL